VPVKLVGSGLGTDYDKDGFTHSAGEVEVVLACLPNIKCYWPGDKQQAADTVKDMVGNGLPSFVGLRR
jgi:transketolase C-terminal domain/subunit